MKRKQWLVLCYVIALQLRHVVQANIAFTVDIVHILCESDRMVMKVNQSSNLNDTQTLDIQVEYSLPTIDQGCPTATHNLSESEVNFEVPLANCGITVNKSSDGQSLIYNTVVTVMAANTSDNSSFVEQQREINLQCEYDRKETLSITLEPDSVDEEDIISYGQFGFSVALYNSENSLLDTSGAVLVPLGDTLIVKVSVTHVSDLRLFLEQIWATPTSDINQSVFPLIDRGCEVNSSWNPVMYSCLDNNASMHSFDMDVFRFVPSDTFPRVYIHLSIMVCSIKASESACDCPNCSNNEPFRKRRSQEGKDDHYDEGSQVYMVTIGPIIKDKEGREQKDSLEKKQETNMTKLPLTTLIIGLVSGFVIIAAIMIAVLFVMRKRKKRATLTVQTT